MTSNQFTPTQQQDLFGLRVAARLAGGTEQLPYEINERLRAARTQALARRKREAVLRTASAVNGGGSATLTMGDEGGFWHRIASALPLIALAAGLVLIHSFENDRRASEIAEVDAALLTDELPPAAYADPGFVQFLKSGQQ